MKYQFDSGVFNFTEPLSVNGQNAVFKGVGTNETTLVFHDCPAFELTMADGTMPVIKDMTIKTDQPGKHDAIKVVCTDASHYYGTGPQFSDLCITGSNVATDYWRIGLDIMNGWWATFKNVTCYGCTADPIAALTGIILRGNSIGVTMDKVNTFFLGDGIEAVDSCEGLSINSSHFVGVRSGIYWHTPSGEPLLNVCQSHFHASLFGIYAVNLMQSIISNNLFYLMEDKYNPAGIWLNNGQDHIITNNIFKVLSPSRRISYGVIGRNIGTHIIKDNIFGRYINNRVSLF
jgi:hypothetical protein